MPTIQRWISITLSCGGKSGALVSSDVAACADGEGVHRYREAATVPHDITNIERSLQRSNVADAIKNHEIASLEPNVTAAVDNCGLACDYARSGVYYVYISCAEFPNIPSLLRVYELPNSVAIHYWITCDVLGLPERAKHRSISSRKRGLSYQHITSCR